MSRELIGRIRGEFIEMPGLKLSFQQACRLWNLSAGPCREALDALRAEGFLYQTPSGAFIAFPSATRMIKAETPSQRVRCPHCLHLNSVNVAAAETTLSFRCAACRKIVGGIAVSA
jgi:Transcriptional regulators